MSKYSLKHILIFSGPIVQILLWTTLNSTIYYAAIDIGSEVVKDTILSGKFVNLLKSLEGTLLQYGVLSLVFVIFLLGGFFADVYLGRYRAVALGQIFTSLCMVTTTVSSVALHVGDNKIVTSACIYVALAFSLLFYIIGMSLVGSNILQFGSDQLMEKPNESLGVFVHWLLWAQDFGYLIGKMFLVGKNCLPRDNQVFNHVLWSIPIYFLVVLIVLLIVSYCTRHRFNRDRVKYNPYKLIYKVLNFARKNKYPVGPVSAFTRCYNFRPSRLDYAKERYGGPFTTSDVEDVKSFKNVFLILLALGPVLVLNVPTTIYFFNMFSLHLGVHVLHELNNGTCDHTLAGGYFSEISSILLFPIYIWLVYSVLRNKPITILQRLLVGVVLYILALASMLVVELTGHLMLYMDLNQAQPLCMFVNQEYDNQRLKMHWFAIVFPIILKSISYDMVLATTLEFISAQSPHTMKGVLVGSFATILGIFHLLGAILLVPFSLDSIWKDGYLGEHPPVISCGFGYYLVCITVALIGLVSLIVAVKRYKYRRRDEEPYSQACVEEIFARRIEDRCQYGDYEELSGTNEYEYEYEY